MSLSFLNGHVSRRARDTEGIRAYGGTMHKCLVFFVKILIWIVFYVDIMFLQECFYITSSWCFLGK